MRRHPPPHPFGIVRPNEQPFPFESNIRAGDNQADDGPPPPLAAAPPSHHVPAMGLGGALIAMHRSNQDAHPRANHGLANRARARRAPRVQSSWILPSFGDIFSGEFIPRRRSTVQEEDIIYPEDDNDDAFFALLTSNADDYYYGNRARIEAQNGRTLRHFEPDYKPAYTHPGKPAPGFTFDFAPSSESSALSSSTSVIVVDDSPGPSTSASSSSHNDDPNTILVCARCMDALVTGDSMTGAEHIRRKIWALRCGHLLDGKCIEELVKPASLAASTVDTSRVADAKGKGKEVVSTEPLPLDKGKGRAIERSDSYDQLDFLSPPVPPESNSIRSRLRPRPHSTASHAPHPPSDPTSVSQRVTRQLPSQWQQTSRQQLVKGKGKGKAKTSLVEAENHWRCPVTGCAKVHTSLLVEGKWIMDDKAGAIAVYV
ncbi:hypothetical protein PILCRDRAFT_817877 [Piloderma croceum F 1598]|uniref:Uncharacterized protein n=1 Tax=Piloderma croceum (strain F 1598) TaxID=765440 RepID=A0A0C3C5U9_PILCF|nr:hypothetical protein PILCRDRAFT_817877 [Piloderma croceum F 1598]